MYQSEPTPEMPKPTASYEQPRFPGSEGAPQFENYDSNQVRKDEDLVPYVEAQIPPKTHLNRQGKVLVGLNTILVTLFTVAGTGQVLAEKPVTSIIDFVNAAVWTGIGVINYHNKNFRK